MQQFTVNKAESGQHLIKYLKHLMPKAQNGFLHKMLRKKNITLNGRKSDGFTPVSEGDVVRLFLSDDTLDMLKGAAPFRMDPDHRSCSRAELQESGNTSFVNTETCIIHEDEDLIIFDKPAGLLSQKAGAGDISANELLIDHLDKEGYVFGSFRPSVLNRLDRNTSGILLFGKTYAASEAVSAMLRDRSLEKHYLTVVHGEISGSMTLSGFLEKDEKTNHVRIKAYGKTAIRTGIKPLLHSDLFSLLDIHLITGKSHQIRAHLASIGHPVVGDPKYGDPKADRKLFELMDIPEENRAKRQLLHAERIIFPKGGKLAKLGGRCFAAPVPKDMSDFARI